MCTIAGFGVINCVLGGSTLAAVSDGRIDSTVGIVIIAIVGMIISFGGYRFLHQYERYSWIFALVAIVITTGVGGNKLFNQVERDAPSAALIISFGGVVAGFLIPWAVRCRNNFQHTLRPPPPQCPFVQNSRTAGRMCWY